MTFYEKFVNLCVENKKSISSVARDIGLSAAAASGWKDGSRPRDVTVAALAQYFGVPVSYFDEKEKPSAESRELTDTQRKAIDLIKSIEDDAVLEIFIAAMEKAIKK